jgi:hypothetical protein
MASRKWLLGTVAVMTFCAVKTISAVPPASCSGKDTLTLTADASVNQHVSPTAVGANYVYAFVCIPTGGSLDEYFPIDLQLDNGETPVSGGDPPGCTGARSVGFSKSGSLAGSTTVPATFNLDDDGTPVSKQIHVSTGALLDGDYDVNVGTTVDANKVDTPNPKSVKIQVHVGPECVTPSVCFYTDGYLNDLLDCAGQPVNGSSGGTFLIVANKKKGSIASSTNPGEFFYSMIWTNSTGSDQDVTINLDSPDDSLLPMGANSVHALTFDSAGFTQNLTNFDMVGADGTPCGPYGPCTVTVLSTETLWVQWHVSWAGVGGSASGLSDTCPGNAGIDAVATLTDSSQAVLDSCEATASGYTK